MAGPTSLFAKLWERHVMASDEHCRDLVAVDRVLLHDRGGGIALEALSAAGRTVRTPSHTFASLDHVVDTRPDRPRPSAFPGGQEFIDLLRTESDRHGIRHFGLDSEQRGITHVIAVEQAIALPGLILACNDSHTATVGGVGALGFGVGSSELEHALGTGGLWFRRPASRRVVVDGGLSPGVEAKDLALACIGTFGAGAGSGFAVEFAGPTIDELEIEGRLTLCNMAVEFAARSAIIAPDQTTIDHLRGRRYAPTGDEWDRAVDSWRELVSDPGASFDAPDLELDARSITPQVTWGLSPADVVGVGEVVPTIASEGAEHAYRTMAVEPGQPLRGLPIEVAFLGSCTNSRLSDLRTAAAVVEGRRVAPGVQAICVPGSTAVKVSAEESGIAATLVAAGFEWRDAGCSLCFYGGGESFGGRRIISSTNRNFENRQGPGAKTHLASPGTVAASAVAGHITDPRELIR